MNKQPWSILPRSTLGKWSLGLIIAMPLLFFIGSSFSDSIYQSVPAGGTIIADIAERPALALTMLAGMGAGISGFITGLIALIQRKDKAVLVVVSTLLGALLILFLVGEVWPDLS